MPIINVTVAVDVCCEPVPKAPVRLPRGAVYLGGISRGVSVHGDELDDDFLISSSQRGRYWVLWVHSKDYYDSAPRSMTVPINWCLAAGLDMKSASQALLIAAWQEPDHFLEWNNAGDIDADSFAISDGLFSCEELNRLMARARGKSPEAS